MWPQGITTVGFKEISSFPNSRAKYIIQIRGTVPIDADRNVIFTASFLSMASDISASGHHPLISKRYFVETLFFGVELP